MWRTAALIAAVLALASWIVLCLVVQPPRIEAALGVEVERALAAVELDDVRAVVDGRDAALEGLVASPDQKAEAERSIAGAPGLRAVDNRLMVREVAVATEDTTYLEIRTSPGGVSLSGGVPSEARRLEIVDRARQIYGADRVKEQLVVDSAAPDGAAFAAAADVVQALAEVAGAEQGVRARLRADSLRLSGTVPSEQTRRRVEEQTRAAASGLRLFFSALAVRPRDDRERS